MRCLKTLTPEAQKRARRHLHAVRDTGIDARIIGGSRTYAEQNALYAQGRSKKGKIVTNARGGQSWHNFGLAYDLGIFTKTGDYLEDSPLYAKAGAIGKVQGLEWGGDWSGIVDEPHFQCKTGKTLAQMRQLVADNGGDIAEAASAIDAVLRTV